MKDPDLHRFISRLVDHAISAAIRTIFWRLPMVVVLVLLALLVGAAIYWKLY